MEKVEFDLIYTAIRHELAAEKKIAKDAEATLTTAIHAKRAVIAHRIDVLTDQHKHQHMRSTDENIVILQQVEVREQMETTIKNDQVSLSVVLREHKQSLKKSHNESITTTTTYSHLNW